MFVSLFMFLFQTNKHKGGCDKADCTAMTDCDSCSSISGICGWCADTKKCSAGRERERESVCVCVCLCACVSICQKKKTIHREINKFL